MSVKDNERAIIEAVSLFASWVPGKNGELCECQLVGSTFGCYPLELPKRQAGKDGMRENWRNGLPYPAFTYLSFFFPSVAKGMFINNSSEHHNVKSTHLFSSTQDQLWCTLAPPKLCWFLPGHRMSYRERMKMHPRMPPATWHSPTALTIFYDLVLGFMDPERHLQHGLHHSSCQSLKYKKAGCSRINLWWELQLLGQPEGLSQQIGASSCSMLIISEAKL